MGAIRLRTRILELEDRDNALILLLRDRNHALLSMIKIDEENTINIEVCDFLPKGHVDGSSYLKIDSMAQLLKIIFENPSNVNTKVIKKPNRIRVFVVFKHIPVLAFDTVHGVLANCKKPLYLC